MVEDEIEYASFKKVLIFGNSGSGKTCLVKRIERGYFSEESPSDNGNIFLIILNKNI